MASKDQTKTKQDKLSKADLQAVNGGGVVPDDVPGKAGVVPDDVPKG